eukprot:sb/3469017/
MHRKGGTMSITEYHFVVRFTVNILTHITTNGIIILDRVGQVCDDLLELSLTQPIPTNGTEKRCIFIVHIVYSWGNPTSRYHIHQTLGWLPFYIFVREGPRDKFVIPVYRRERGIRETLDINRNLYSFIIFTLPGVRYFNEIPGEGLVAWDFHCCDEIFPVHLHRTTAPLFFVTPHLICFPTINPWDVHRGSAGKTLKSGCLSLLTIRSFGARDGLGLSVRVWLGFGLGGSVRAIDSLSDAV